ncbi:hypothetical protein ACKWRH_45560 (plasmid) [Bradyrhizobium sp. Pa8]|uniref:hypothetical protein n=1 Tax=Bradyrhizobium sp. Pa8 TaxID=3386552 RepID=UPI00403FA16A
MNAKPNGVQESLDFIIAHMATKTDLADGLAGVEGTIAGAENRLVKEIADLREQANGIERELREVHRDLDALRIKVENIEGYRIEIDHALERIATIEKHLGIRNKLAA